MRILVIAPYPDLVETGLRAAGGYHHTVTVRKGNLHEGVRIAREETEAQTVDAVVSRGGTASLLRTNMTLPVFEIHVTGYDLLRAVYPHLEAGRRVAVVGYENVVSGAQSIAGIMGCELGYFLVRQQTAVEKLIEDARGWGADVVVGDTVSVVEAERAGMRAELVRSGPEAVMRALDAAVTFYEHLQNEMVRNKRLNSILEHNDRGVLYLGSDGTIELLNGVAERFLRRGRDDLIGKRADSGLIPSALAEAIRTEAVDELIEVGDKQYVVEVVPLTADGRRAATLVYLHSSGKIRDLEAMIRRQMTSRGLVANYTFDRMVVESPAFARTVERARRYAMTDSTILLLGETGTGKEVFAQSMHNASSRSGGPFVAVNCAALPDSLLESELFGYAEGAFTGAKKGGKPGLFEMAHGGTIFLDEVNDMSRVVQARFLRVLQEKQVMRVGDDRLYDIDVRVIAACNRDLLAEANAGTFRQDLYYRLRVLDISILPLRERQADIIPLFSGFVEYFARQHAYDPPALPERLRAAVAAHDWPGNVRELRNFAEKVSILLSIDERPEELVPDLVAELSPGASGVIDAGTEPGGAARSLKDIEASVVCATWERNGRNISRTARELGIDRATVRKKVSSR